MKRLQYLRKVIYIAGIKPQYIRIFTVYKSENCNLWNRNKCYFPSEFMVNKILFSKRRIKLPLKKVANCRLAFPRSHTLFYLWQQSAVFLIKFEHFLWEQCAAKTIKAFILLRSWSSALKVFCVSIEFSHGLLLDIFHG